MTASVLEKINLKNAFEFVKGSPFFADLSDMFRYTVSKNVTSLYKFWWTKKIATLNAYIDS